MVLKNTKPLRITHTIRAERPNKPLTSRTYLVADAERAGAGVGAGDGGDARGLGETASGAGGGGGGEGRPNGWRGEE